MSESLVAQYGSGALPQTEQMAVGGQSLVRGYSIDDGSYDNGFVAAQRAARPDLHPGPGPAGSTPLAPYAFFDFGHGWEREVHTHAAPASVGAGLDDQLTAHSPRRSTTPTP